MVESKYTVRQETNKIVLRPVKQHHDLTPMEAFNMINNLRNAVTQHEDAIRQAKEAQVNSEKELEQIKADLQAIEKFEKWALERQHSKLRVLVAELTPKVVEKVNSTYKDDVTLDAEQNKRQRFVQYRGYLASDPQVVSSIAAEIIRDKLYVNCDLKNPWADGFVAPVAVVGDFEESEPAPVVESVPDVVVPVELDSEIKDETSKIE